MTSGEIEQRGSGPALPAMMNGGNLTATGQAEVARAIAEVMAAVQLARAYPRDMDVADRRVRLSCTRYSFARRAFYSYPRGNRWDNDLGQWVPNIISGPSVHLARELAAAFQNMESGWAELDRDTDRGYSVVRAFCRDNEMNTTETITWLVPLVVDKWEGPKGKRVKVKERLEDERDRYERIANEAARRQRKVTLDALPAWFVDEAIALCNRTLAQGEPDENGELVPEPKRMALAVEKFGETFGIRKDQLERHVGAQFPNWRTHDLARLTVLFETLVSGGLRVDEVFPEPEAAGADADGAPAVPAERPPLMGNTRLELDRLFKEAGLGGRTNTQRRMRIAGVLAAEELELPGGPVRVAQWKDLSNTEAQAAQAGVRKLMAMDDADRNARIEELDEMGRRAAQVPEDGKREAEEPAIERLRAMFTEAGRGDPEQHRDLMLAVTAVAVHGHYEDLASLEALSQEQIEYAIGRLRGVFADARRREQPLGDRMDVLYQSAVQQRAARDAADDDPGPAEPAG